MLRTSSAAEVSGAVVPMPTLWAWLAVANPRLASSRVRKGRKFFLINKGSKWLAIKVTPAGHQANLFWVYCKKSPSLLGWGKCGRSPEKAGRQTGGHFLIKGGVYSSGLAAAIISKP